MGLYIMMLYPDYTILCCYSRRSFRQRSYGSHKVNFPSLYILLSFIYLLINIYSIVLTATGFHMQMSRPGLVGM